MKKANQYHVVHNSNGGWDVKKAGNLRATAQYDTKVEAVSSARILSINNRSELVIHGTDGKIQYKDSHGNDPCPPKDKK